MDVSEKNPGEKGDAAADATAAEAAAAAAAAAVLSEAEDEAKKSLNPVTGSPPGEGSGCGTDKFPQAPDSFLKAQAEPEFQGDHPPPARRPWLDPLSGSLGLPSCNFRGVNALLKDKSCCKTYCHYLAVLHYHKSYCVSHNIPSKPKLPQIVVDCQSMFSSQQFSAISPLIPDIADSRPLCRKRRCKTEHPLCWREKRRRVWCVLEGREAEGGAEGEQGVLRPRPRPPPAGHHARPGPQRLSWWRGEGGRGVRNMKKSRNLKKL